MNVASANIVLSDQHFQRVIEIAATEAGLAIPETKKSLVQSRVARRMRTLGLSDCGEYLDSLPGNSTETQHFISALTTNVSHFFREAHHFEYIREKVLTKTTSKRLRFWSAGCSNGQEPYSLAMEIIKSVPNAGKMDVLILATDIDDTVLEKASRGIYSETEIEGVPEPDRKRFLTRQQNGQYQINEELRKLVRFRKLNLNSPNWPMKGPFDAILCRNVVIYFSDETQNLLWPRFRNLLGTSGSLLLGHSERIVDVEGMGFQVAGVTTYQKT